jgi:MoaA/NifB/PqqE/SkfB family radical SAM enzyme
MSTVPKGVAIIRFWFIFKQFLRGNMKKDKNFKQKGIGEFMRSALWMWGRSSPSRMLFFLRVGVKLLLAKKLKEKKQKSINGIIPAVIAISPTMRCNYNCTGCYSRDRISNNELKTEELDSLYSEAEQLGVLSVVVTGGEPYLRNDTIELMEKHKKLLFIPITNGSKITSEFAERIRESRNIIQLVSIEGLEEHTDNRRKKGSYETAVRAMKLLRDAGACFGFAATNTSGNSIFLGTEPFIDRMIELGCTLGYFTEYVPCGPHPQKDWLLSEEERKTFREKVLYFRRRKPIVLVQFPQDEYGEENRCTAAGIASLHINSEGGIEPCPFINISLENIRNGGLKTACESPFLKSIREREYLLKREKLACSLFEHYSELEEIAEEM